LVIDAHVAYASAFLPLARDLHDRCGLIRPQEFEDATRHHHLTKALSIELPEIPHGREPMAPLAVMSRHVGRDRVTTRSEVLDG